MEFARVNEKVEKDIYEFLNIFEYLEVSSIKRLDFNYAIKNPIYMNHAKKYLFGSYSLQVLINHGIIKDSSI